MPDLTGEMSVSCLAGQLFAVKGLTVFLTLTVLLLTLFFLRLAVMEVSLHLPMKTSVHQTISNIS